MELFFILTLTCAIALASIHIGISKLAVRAEVPRSGWLSLAGGVTVTYVFLHLLPRLAEHQRTLQEGAIGSGAAVYALALAGLVMFYGLERLIQNVRTPESSQGSSRARIWPFWVHIYAFAVYNLLVGYLLLHREEAGWASLALYFLAMALHFFANDFWLHKEHQRIYDRSGRWVLAGAVLLGWAAGATITLPEAAQIALFSFLSGAIILNVLKEELPEHRRSRFLPFFAGAVVYGALELVA